MDSKLNAQIYEEACEWFIECRSGDLDEESRKAFDDWLRNSPQHLRAYLELAAIWNEGSSLDPAGRFDRATLIAEAATDRDNVVELWTARAAQDGPLRASSKAADPSALNESPSKQLAPSHPGRFRRRYVAVAASLALCVLATLLYVRESWAPTYATAVGEQRSLVLSDGSTAQLNSRSKMRVRFSRQARDIELLEGQALFHVAKDASRPFIVKVGATKVRAVGTEFDVYQKHADTVVTVIEGRVAVIADFPAALPAQKLPPTASDVPDSSNLPFRNIAPGSTNNIMVGAGQQLTLTPKIIQIVEHPNIASATAWTQRQLIFESASLADVADEFNRYNARQLIIGDAGLEGFHVSGVFSSTDPASLIRFLQARPELRVLETDFQIRIEKN